MRTKYAFVDDDKYFSIYSICISTDHSYIHPYNSIQCSCKILSDAYATIFMQSNAFMNVIMKKPDTLAFSGTSMILLRCYLFSFLSDSFSFFVSSSRSKN